jgi:hypothetical protein
MPMYSEPVAVARHRLEVLTADTVGEHQRDHRRLTAVERSAVVDLLYELHRLHLVVSTQAKRLATLQAATNRQRGKPVAARSRIPRKRGTRAKPGASQVVTLSNERLDGKKALRK